MSNSMFNEVNQRGQLRVPRQGNKNLLSTVPFSLDPDNKSGIAPLEFPSGLALFKTTAGLIHQGEASNLHPDQLKYPINEIIYDGVEPRHQITDELVFVKPDQPTPPRQYALLSNHELELQQIVWPDGTPKNILTPNAIHIREDLYKKHLVSLQDINQIQDAEVQSNALRNEMSNLLVSDPLLYNALYNKQVAAVVNNRDEIRDDVEVEDEKDVPSFVSADFLNEYRQKSFNEVIISLQNNGEVTVQEIKSFTPAEIDMEGRTSLKTAALYLVIQHLPEDKLGLMKISEIGALANKKLNETDKTGIIRKGGVKLTSLEKRMNFKNI